MSIIKCPECGKAISDKAESCPHCGYPLGNEKKRGFQFDGKPAATSAGQKAAEHLAGRQTAVGTFSAEPMSGVLFIIAGMVTLLSGFLMPVLIIFAVIGGILFIGLGVSKFTPHADCTCPYCEAKGTIAQDAINYRCPACRKISVYVKEDNCLKTVP